MQNAPLSIVIVEVLKHTPAYVWAILAALIIFGSLQMRDQMVGRARVLLLPVGLGAYSLWGAASAFGVQWDVFAAWAVGMGAMLWAARSVGWPRKVEFLPERNAFAVGGSFLPLAAQAESPDAIKFYDAPSTLSAAQVRADYLAMDRAGQRFGEAYPVAISNVASVRTREEVRNEYLAMSRNGQRFGEAYPESVGGTTITSVAGLHADVR